jgi:hypothetical protein
MKNIRNWLISFTAFILIVILGTVPFALPNFALEKNNQENSVSQPINTKPCINSRIQISIELPADWECTNTDRKYESDMTVNNNFFNIRFGLIPDYAGCTNPGCISTLYKNDVLTVNKVKDGSVYSINGNINNYTVVTSYPDNEAANMMVSIVITYPDMQSRDLTGEEFNQLKSVLDTVKTLK